MPALQSIIFILTEYYSQSRIPNPESRIPNPQSRIPNPESPIPNPCFQARLADEVIINLSG
ncbi:MAG: hypothetical protein HEQ19_16070 [Gloeotrichia echinulata CP02]